MEILVYNGERGGRGGEWPTVGVASPPGSASEGEEGRGCIIGGRCRKYHFCHDKTRLLSRQKYPCNDKTFVFVATKDVFVATKMIVVAAPASDRGEEGEG